MGVARARHARVSLRNGPFSTILDSLCSSQGFEMSVARPHRRFSTVENRVTSIPRQHMSVRPETQGKHSACVVAPSLPHTLADCAPPRPQPHRRFSTVENRPCRPPAPTCVCKHLSDRIPEVAKLPAPSRHRSPTRSQTVLGSRHSPIAVSRATVKIGRVDRQLAPKHLSDRIPEVGKLPARLHGPRRLPNTQSDLV